MERGADVDSRLQDGRVGGINSEPGLIDVELGALWKSQALGLGETWDGNRWEDNRLIE